MTTPPLREAARVIALDDDQRVLLLHYDEGGRFFFWATPGGALEKDEDYITAVLRELHEELGIAEKDIDLGDQIAERSQNHAVGGREVRQIERYFAARITRTAIDPTRATQTDNIRAHRWWTLDELRTASETVFPLGLADLITEFLASGVPDRPVVLH